MFAPKAYLESLAILRASSKLETLQIGATGPKLSLLKISISDEQSIKTVASTNQPRLNSDGRPPPTMALAPCFDALDNKSSYRLRSFSETSGPISTLSKPLPILIFLVSSTKRSTNSS